MRKLLFLLTLVISIAASSQTTAFTAHLKDLAQTVPLSPEAPPAFIELTLRNCAGAGTNPTIVHVNGGAVVVFPVNLYPDVTGLVSKNLYDETQYVCGASAGVAYYHVRIYQGDSTRSAIKKLLFEDDFDIQGASFLLDSATPRSGSVITPPPATAVLTNPAGNQTVVQPVGTALSVNHLSAGFAQSANGTDMIPANRFTDTSPTGNFLNFKNAAGSSSLWQVDVTGSLLAGIIPNARLGTAVSGTGSCTNQFVRVLNSSAAPTCATVGSSDLASSLALTTPNIGAATGTSLNLDATGVLSTTAQSGTGSLCMTTNCVMTTPTVRGTMTVATGSGTLPASFANDAAGGLLFTTNAGRAWQMQNTGNLTGPGGNPLVLQGGTSGFVALNPPSVAGSSQLTLPAATDTLVGKATTDTLTNKTLTSPAFTGTETGMSITSPAMTSPTINTGVSQGSGFKHQRFGATCTTAATADTACTTTYSWTSAFADNSYTVNCQGEANVGNVAALFISSQTASQITVAVVTYTATAVSFSGVNCIAVHD
jgi:hypothetical protein